ncbi:MAG TPA: DUF5611 family protein [Thermoplasmata archaeon]|nr:DUF5611 family protein [Thermoplasmata archaeon]
MQQYPVKSRGHPPLSTDRIEQVAREEFGEARRDGERVVAAFGAISELRGWVDGKWLGIELKMNPQVETALQAETIRRYNRFLETLTGFSSKERAKRLKKAATAADVPE